MGLIDFVKSAGAKMFGKDEPEPSTEDTARFNQQRAELLERAVTNMGIEIENFEVEASDDQVTVKGTAKTQEEREKAVLIVGNHSGIARVDDQLQVKPAPEATYHTVESGDTLWAIAKAQYGDGSKYTMIFEANTPMLEDPDKIYPGQVLRIPILND